MGSPYEKPRRTQEEIIADLAAGHLDMGELKLAEEVTVEKFDLSGDGRRLDETRRVIMRDGAVVEHHIIKH